MSTIEHETMPAGSGNIPVWHTIGPDTPNGIVAWEDPPAKGKTRYEQTAEALKNRPNTWAVVEEKRDDKSTNSSQIRKALNELLGAEQVQVHEHSIGAGVKRVYARYTLPAKD